MTTTKVSTGISYSQCFLTHWNHWDMGTRLGFGPRHVDRSQKDSRHRPTAASSPAVKGHKKALHAPLHPPEPWLQSGLIISKPGGREGARFGGDGNPAWVTSDPSGELGTNTAKQPHPVPATWLNRSAQADLCSLREEIKHTEHVTRLASTVPFLLFFFPPAETHPPFLFTSNGRKGWKKLLPHHRGVSPCSTVQLKRNFACFPKNSHSWCLCKEDTEEESSVKGEGREG